MAGVPASSSSSCPGCGAAVDPLRAGHVAMLDGGFRYFCRAECKRAFLHAEGRSTQEEVATAAPPAVAPSVPPPSRPASRPPPRAAEPQPVRKPEPEAEPELQPEREAAAVQSPPSSRVVRARPKPVSGRLEMILSLIDATGLIVGALVPAMALLEPMGERARLPLVFAALAALCTRVAMAPRDASDVHPLLLLAPSAGATAAACWAAVVHDARAPSIAVLAGLSCAAGIAIEMLVTRSRARTAAARDGIERSLELTTRVLRGDETHVVPAADVRPGEQIVAEAGDTLGVDATVTAGEARVVPWLDARGEVVKRDGDPIVAGARVVSNRLRLRTAWSGRERAWVRLVATPEARVDVAAPTPRTLRLVVQRGAPIAAGVVGIAAFAANGTAAEILAAMCAGATAFGARAAASFVSLHFARGHLEALASGITFKDARAFERAAAANVAVLSARGTVLMGEPEIVSVEPFGAIELERVLSLAAGAETASTHPFAAAILRAARARDVRPDNVRNATVHEGLGVTALASSGERLAVGGRALMLEEKIGVAVADSRVSELEAQGRSVLLVAVGDRLVGLIALMDGLRPGARAAVQRLLDSRIEPVLLSGEARDTCETIGRALDIEHVRPEVLPADRGPEVRALAEGGSVVAVVGHPQRDDGALGAADVSVAMGSAGSTPGEWSVSLASDDVRDAATALAIPHAARERARAAIVLGVAPGLVALLAIGFGVAPLAVAPLGALLGALAVAVHARESPPV
jgi:cation transport ATPase